MAYFRKITEVIKYNTAIFVLESPYVYSQNHRTINFGRDCWKQFG